MIGAAISGITFISVPGEVGNSQFSYFQLVLGIGVGLMLIAIVFLPLYYKMRVVSIYSYLENRFGFWTYKTGASFFLLSQTLMASIRLYLMASVLQIGLFNRFNFPFEATVLITLLLIWLYTFRSGIKTVVFTDTLQTTFLLLSVILSIWIICKELGFSFNEMISSIQSHPDSKIFFWDWHSPKYFLKLLFTGILLTVVTNGLDHSVMQKHLTCPNLKESQKNMFLMSFMIVLVNLLFLGLGLLLYIFAKEKGIPIPAKTDDLYPQLALNHFNTVTGMIFLLGISAAAYSSADSALTGLTTSFCVDFLNFEKNSTKPPKVRSLVHFGFSMLIFFVILIFKILNNESVINAFIRISGYTYGPLLGLFIFGMFTRFRIRDHLVPWLCISAPIFSIILYFNSEKWLFGYKFGFEMLIVNSLFTFIGLLFIQKAKDQ
jgi:Na+/proline symporter